MPATSSSRVTILSTPVLAALALSALRASADRGARFIPSADPAIERAIESTVEAVEEAARIRLTDGEVDVVRAVVVAFHAGGGEASRRVWSLPRTPVTGPRTRDRAAAVAAADQARLSGTDGVALG